MLQLLKIHFYLFSVEKNAKKKSMIFIWTFYDFQHDLSDKKNLRLSRAVAVVAEIRLDTSFVPIKARKLLNFEIRNP
jgi:hypothetical protein